MRDPIQEFVDYNRPFAQRNAELLRFTFARMAESAFAFFRGAVEIRPADKVFPQLLGEGGVGRRPRHAVQQFAERRSVRRLATLAIVADEPTRRPVPVKEYDIYAPLKYNDGSPVEAKKISCRSEARNRSGIGTFRFGPQSGQTPVPKQEFGNDCACKRVESAGWKSLPRFGLDFVAKGNCVVARRGGEQPEAKDWSVG